MNAVLSIEWLGEVPYGEALALQAGAVADRVADRTCDRLLLLTHPPVVTLGRRTDPANLHVSAETLRERGVEVFDVARGGDVTYHAPGQLVGYPIVSLAARGRRDVYDHLRRLERGVIDAVESFGVPACRVDGRTGVFVDRARSPRAGDRDRKLASIGVGLRRWVTFHGFALNVTIDLEGFDSIVPCGLHDVEMTSLDRELAFAEAAGARVDRSDLDDRIRERIGAAMRQALCGVDSPIS